MEDLDICDGTIIINSMQHCCSHNSRFATDIDECANPDFYNNCSATENLECHNTNGSFTCECKAGYNGRSDGQCEGNFVTLCKLLKSTFYLIRY